MVQMTRAALRDLLAARYDEFRIRLMRKLGSEELASVMLHETWLRLHRQDEVGPVKSPTGYLMRMAVNIATDFHRAEGRRLRRSEVRSMLEIADLAPGPEQLAEAHFAFEAFQRAVRELPERARAILIAARIEGVPHQAIADRFGISKRMVQIELKRAVEYCEAQLDRKVAADFASVERGSSDASRPAGLGRPDPASPGPHERLPSDGGS
jgi:RNA polymerase sigma factor (sigma-70 family)